jgi:hypothetical protein
MVKRATKVFGKEKVPVSKRLSSLSLFPNKCCDLNLSADLTFKIYFEKGSFAISDTNNNTFAILSMTRRKRPFKLQLSGDVDKIKEFSMLFDRQTMSPPRSRERSLDLKFSIKK